MRYSHFVHGILAVALVTGFSSGAGAAESVSYVVKDDAIQKSLTGNPGLYIGCGVFAGILSLKRPISEISRAHPTRNFRPFGVIF